jgi:hypothetical protein
MHKGCQTLLRGAIDNYLKIGALLEFWGETPSSIPWDDEDRYPLLLKVFHAIS